MTKPFVAILMGSDSDLPIMEASFDVLEKLGIAYEAKVTSAHRTPDATHSYVKDADKRGCAAFICAAGMAAHLAGALKAHSTLPVIGVPLAGGTVDGLDALLSTVQMPKGVPVATMAVGKSGAINAAILTAEILSLNNTRLSEKLTEFKNIGSKL